MSKIPAETLKAYRSALYRVKARPRGFTLQVGRVSKPLAKLLKEEGLSTAAFLTASNPRGFRRSRGLNQKAHQKLLAVLRRRGFSFLPAMGKDPKRKWPGEVSLLILGLGLAEAKALGRRFGQNALVLSGKNARPRLVLLR